MFKYHLMGKVYKNEYVIDQYESKDFYADALKYLNISYFGTYHREYNLKDATIEILLTELKNERESYCSKIGIYKYSGMYKNEQDYKDKHKIQEQKLLAKHIFDRYEEFDTIETDIELRDGETIKIQDNSYQVSYEFNKDLHRHELYISYEVKIEVDEELKKQCEDKLIELNNRINEYNKMIDESKITIDERFKNYIKPDDKPIPIKGVYKEGWLLNKIKNLFKEKHE